MSEKFKPGDFVHLKNYSEGKFIYRVKRILEESSLSIYELEHIGFKEDEFNTFLRKDYELEHIPTKQIFYNDGKET